MKNKIKINWNGKHIINTKYKSKTLDIKEDENEYKYQIQIIRNFIQVSLYLDNKLKYEGNISLQNIQNQIFLFYNNNINEIFEEINNLSKDNFKIRKIDNK